MNTHSTSQIFPYYAELFSFFTYSLNPKWKSLLETNPRIIGTFQILIKRYNHQTSTL